MAGELNLRGVRIEGALTLASDAEVDALEQELGTRLPSGYRAYVSTLGEGVLDDLVRVFPPWRIRGDIGDHRSWLAAYWFWMDDTGSFGQDEAMLSIPIADTTDGSAIASSPGDPRLFILPRDGDRVLVRSDGLLELVEWICGGGFGHEGLPSRRFQAWDSRAITSAGPVQAAVELPPMPAPDLTRPPRDVLLAYFTELAALEAWAAAHVRQIVDPTLAPDDERYLDELVARAHRASARYGTAVFARGMRGASVNMTAPPDHAVAGVRILEEIEERPGRVRILASHQGVRPGIDNYVLELAGNDWRIASHRVDFGHERR